MQRETGKATLVPSVIWKLETYSGNEVVFSPNQVEAEVVLALISELQSLRYRQEIETALESLSPLE